jgi:hypothetical protein
MHLEQPRNMLPDNFSAADSSLLFAMELVSSRLVVGVCTLACPHSNHAEQPLLFRTGGWR